MHRSDLRSGAMSSNITITDDEEGKRVLNARGDEIGRVTEVRNGVAYVDPDPSITDTIKAKLGWGEKDDEEAFRLDPSNVEAVTDDEIHLVH